MKARKVKGLEPAEPLADNAERIVRVRLDEMCGFMPQAADPAEVVALHDMRIAAKRLRYILEITAPIFGDYAATAVRLTKDVQDLLGEIHDCDVQIPEVQAFLDELVAEDARRARRGGGRRRGPRPARRAPRAAPQRPRRARRAARAPARPPRAALRALPRALAASTSARATAPGWSTRSASAPPRPADGALTTGPTAAG